MSSLRSLDIMSAKSTKPMLSLVGVSRYLCSGVRSARRYPALPLIRAFSSTQRRDNQRRVTPRPIFYAFDPVESPINPHKSDTFAFLLPQELAKAREFQHSHAITPSSLGVPWPTYFPSALESRYWPEVEETARNFLQLVLADQTGQDKGRQIDMVLDAVVSFTVHVVPMGDVARMKTLAKANILAFMHDDAVDTGNYNAAIPDQSNAELECDRSPPYGGYHILAKEVLAEEPSGLGQRLLDSVRSWASIGSQRFPTTFSSLEDYMFYRIPDVGAHLVFRTVEFACGVHLTDEDLASLDKLTDLCARHFLLTNDIYSYEKEVRGADANDNKPQLFNAVRVVQDLMNVSPSSAKQILRNVIWEVEHHIYEEYKHLRQKDASASQMVYARGLIAAIAGNMYYSATSARYARVVEGSRLAAR